MQRRWRRTAERSSIAVEQASSRESPSLVKLNYRWKSARWPASHRPITVYLAPVPRILPPRASHLALYPRPHSTLHQSSTPKRHIGQKSRLLLQLAGFRRNIARRFDTKSLDWYGYQTVKKTQRICLLISIHERDRHADTRCRMAKLQSLGRNEINWLTSSMVATDNVFRSVSCDIQ